MVVRLQVPSNSDNEGFRIVSERLLGARYESYKDILKKFLTYIDSDEKIKEYIDGCGEPTINIPILLSNDMPVTRNKRPFNMGSTEKEEVANIVSLLRYFVEKGEDLVLRIGFNYSRPNSDLQKMTDAIKDDLFRILIMYIEAHLRRVH